jgi:type I pantothenate kinase
LTREPLAADASALAEITRLLADRRAPGRPLVVGLTGAVAAGKSTFAGQICGHLQSGPQPLRVEIVCTDGFLMSNARLMDLGLLDLKGFPPSYDAPALQAALEAIQTGPATFPAYSHVIYDIDPALARVIEPPDVLIVEGLNLHERPPALDLLIYLDADEGLLESWFLARFMGLWEAAEHDPSSFYARFRTMSRADTEKLARMVWEQVNLRNLHEHISRARSHADLIVRKGADHAIIGVEQGAGPA